MDPNQIMGDCDVLWITLAPTVKVVRIIDVMN